MADIGVHGKGKVHRGGAARQRHDLALGREHIDFVGKQVDLDVFQKFGRVAMVGLDVEQRLQPAMGARLHVVERGIRRFVHPVRGHAGFGQPVHVGGADLHFDRGAVGAEQDRVQRLVAVGLGNGDVILELAGNRLVQAMQRTQRQIAGRLVAYHHAKAVDVEYFGECQVLFLHLAIDAVTGVFRGR